MHWLTDKPLTTSSSVSRRAKYLSLALLLLLSLHSHSQSLAAATDAPTANAPITVAMFIGLDIPPYRWLDRCHNIPIGSSVHFLNRMARGMDTPVAIHYMDSNAAADYTQLKQAFFDNKYDFMMLSANMGQYPTTTKIATPLSIFYGNIAIDSNNPENAFATPQVLPN